MRGSLTEMAWRRLRASLTSLYGASDATLFCEHIAALLEGLPAAPEALRRPSPFLQTDTLLIAYPDHVTTDGLPPLLQLANFLGEYIPDAISMLHVLPAFEADGDFGFQVTDHMKIAEALGDWTAIEALARQRRLVIDLVCNHVSSASDWFLRYAEGHADFQGFFIEEDSDFDLSKVSTPPAGDLFSPHQRAAGEVRLWCRYGRDQIDLNYRNWRVLLAVSEVLLHYASKGATLVRLDAIAFVWKESGTTCANLPQNHLIVRVFRALLDLYAPGTALVAEVDCVGDTAAYLAPDRQEAQLVYDYALPPLICHSLLQGDAQALGRYLNVRPAWSGDAAPLNILSTHDGLYLRPHAPALSPHELDGLLAHATSRGGICIERMHGGVSAAYECDISVAALLRASEDSPRLAAERMVAGLFVLLSIPGVPAIYLNLLLGADNDQEKARLTGHPRAINRKTYTDSELEKLLAPDTQADLTLRVLRRLLAARANLPDLAPATRFDLAGSVGGVLAFHRGEKLFCAVNLSDRAENLELPAGFYRDVISDHLMAGEVQLQAYQCLWLQPSARRETGPSGSEDNRYIARARLAYDQRAFHHESGQPLRLDPAYRRNHLPLTEPRHPDVITSDDSTDYLAGRYDRARTSIVLFVPWSAFEASEGYRAFNAALKGASFSGKIAWRLHLQRKDRLHATVCNLLHLTHSPDQITASIASIEKQPAFDVRLLGPWLGHDRNNGRIYLPLTPERRGQGDALGDIQEVAGVNRTRFYGLGVQQFTDHLHPEEAEELEGILARFRDSSIAEIRVRELALIRTHDDLILNSRVIRRIQLR